MGVIITKAKSYFQQPLFYVKFEVFMAVTIKNAVFCGVVPCRSCEPLSHLSWFLTRRFFYPEDVGNMLFRNVDSHKIYTAPHPRRWHSSISVPFSYCTVSLRSAGIGFPHENSTPGYSHNSFAAYYFLISFLK
jgi:hypothetical protein